MKHRAKLLTFPIATVVIFALTILSASTRPQLTEQSKVAIDGIGPVRVGMTIAQAEASAGVRLVEKGGRAGTGGCYYVWPQPEIEGLAFMVISDRSDNRIERNRDRIARVDVFEGSRLTTVSGARIGDTEARIKSLYPGKIKVTPHHYTWDSGGHYLTYVPQDSKDRNYRLIFETYRGRVTQFRAGQLPEVDYIEGCA